MWRGRLEAEEPNLQAALAWTVANEPRTGMQLAVALWPYWDMRWGEREAVAHLERLLAAPERWPARSPAGVGPDRRGRPGGEPRRRAPIAAVGP